MKDLGRCFIVGGGRVVVLFVRIGITWKGKEIV